METSLKLVLRLSYDPAIPLLGTYPKDTISLYQKLNCPTMFTAAQVITAQIWAHPRYTSSDRQISKPDFKDNK